MKADLATEDPIATKKYKKTSETITETYTQSEKKVKLLVFACVFIRGFGFNDDLNERNTE